MKRIAILGSTGSIGVNTLDVVEKNPAHFRTEGLAAGRNVRLLAEQIDRFRPRLVSVVDSDSADNLKDLLEGRFKPSVFWGSEGYREVATAAGVEIVVAAMVGAAGLIPTMEAINARKNIALANKETLVTGGALVMEAAENRGVRIIPVDSEHSAIYQCLEGHRTVDVRRIILTASGGPFFGWSAEDLEKVTPGEALKHPTWSMGRKITIDSATLMNKGLEVIEARWLFDTDVDRIDVRIHPQSVIHSMVEYVDGSIIAQMGVPDMRGPISYALGHPERVPAVHPFLNMEHLAPLTFLQPDMERFRCLALAYEAGRAGGTLPAALNGANEVAVEAFLSGEIGFRDISRVVEASMACHNIVEPLSISHIMEVDGQARTEARKQIVTMKMGR